MMDQEEGEISDHGEEIQDLHMEFNPLSSNGIFPHPCFSSSGWTEELRIPTDYPGSNNGIIPQSSMRNGQFLELGSETDIQGPKNIVQPRDAAQQSNLTVQEMRRKAQAAVMYLACSLKLSFHDIIGEGIDKDVLRSIFEQLRLPIPPIDDGNSQTIRVVGKHGGSSDVSDNQISGFQQSTLSHDQGDNDGIIAQKPQVDAVPRASSVNQSSSSEIDLQSSNIILSSKTQPTPVKARKRPVATDFNSEPIFAQTTTKHRKFGDRLGARDARLILDVSDDEEDTQDYNLNANDGKIKDSPQPGASQTRLPTQSNTMSNGSNSGSNFALSQAIRDQEKKIQDLNKMIQQRSKRQKNSTSAANTPPIISSKPATPVPNTSIDIDTNFTVPEGLDMAIDRALAPSVTSEMASVSERLVDVALDDNADMVGVTRPDPLFEQETINEVSQMDQIQDDDNVTQLYESIHASSDSGLAPNPPETNNHSISPTKAAQDTGVESENMLSLDEDNEEGDFFDGNKAGPHDSDTTSNSDQLEESDELARVPGTSTGDWQTNQYEAGDSAQVDSSPMSLASQSESGTSSMDHKQASPGLEGRSFGATVTQADESSDQFVEDDTPDRFDSHETPSATGGHTQSGRLDNEPQETGFESSEKYVDTAVVLERGSRLEPGLATPQRAQTQMYSSPLAVFKSFRFHPQYLGLVSGGFKSLTYSHMIDPNRAFCHYETQGGSCNDASCTWQHFRQIIMPEDRILLELASTEGATEEEQLDYKQRLHSEIIHLTQSGIQDFETVATKIVEFRRSYLADPTRIIRNI